MQLKETDKIAKLISKYLLDCITEDELVQLNQWINESSDNEKVFKEFCDQEFYKKKRSAELKADYKVAYKEFLSRKSNRSLKRFIYPYRKIAAASVFFLIGIAAWIYFNKSDTQPIPVVNQTMEVIAPGEMKAVLTMANGKKVELTDKIQDVLIEGNGDLIRASKDGIAYTESPHMQELVFNELEVPIQGEYTLTLGDGTKVWLNSKSKIKYPISFLGEERRVELEGEAYFEVSRDVDKPFYVMANGAVIEVLGTSFNIKAYPSDRSVLTTLVEGKVSMNTSDASVILNPNEQGVFDVLQGKLAKREVDVELYMGWKNGRFVFDNQPLSEIMASLDKWYGLEIIYEIESIKHLPFSGNIKRYENLNKTLDMLEKTQEIKFRKEGNRLYIYKK